MAWHKGHGRKGRELRRRIGESQNWRCCHCGERFVDEPGHRLSMTLDHVVPRSRGGGSGWRNLVAACLGCNGARGDAPAVAFRSRHHARAKREATTRESFATLADVWPEATTRGARTNG